MIKLIASDLDGTLLRNGAQALNPDVFPLIQKLKENTDLAEPLQTPLFSNHPLRY